MQEHVERVCPRIASLKQRNSPSPITPTLNPTKTELITLTKKYTKNLFTSATLPSS